jgi:hypothetical protein
VAAPSSASGWTNSGNVVAADGAYASAAAQRDAEGGGNSSDGLVATGFGFSGGAGDTVNGITVQVNARYFSTFGTLHVYLLNNGTPVGSEKVTGLSTSFSTYTFGSSSDTWGAGFTGSNIANLQVGCYVEIATDLGHPGSCEGRIDWITAVVDISDTTPNAFSFTDQTNVALSSTMTSDSITVAGITAAAAISVSGGEYEVNNSGSWVTGAGTVNNGNTVRVRHTSSGSNGTATNTTLTIGGVSDTFTSTTLTADTTPDAFSFTPQTGVNPSQQVFSNQITVTGINTTTTWSRSGGYGVWFNGTFMATAASGTLSPGDQLNLVLDASASYNTLVSATLTIGGVSAQFDVTTRAADTTPNAFAFTDQSGVAQSTLCTSDTITVAGIEAAAAISISGGAGEYQINGGAWVTGAGSVNNGDTVKVRHTSSASLSSSVNSTLTIGGVSDTFTTTTVGADSTPDAITFTAVKNKPAGRKITSNAATITGINVGVGVTCSAGADFSINGGAFSTTGTITNGQTVAVRVRSSIVPGRTITATVTIGGVTGNFLVTTVRSPQADL